MNHCKRCSGVYQYGLDPVESLLSNGLCRVCDYLIRVSERPPKSKKKRGANEVRKEGHHKGRSSGADSSRS